MDCEHEFEVEENFRENTIFEDEIISVPVKCKNCGLLADEVWTFSCYTDRFTGEEV